ncbi:MAG: hypothetical protein KBB21_27995 [Nannocystaceae bacterium]|nr:hypothetical protein [Deltaproteobacteria bacterium]MBP7290500.1 hypothetical protein [Nannocystaceae bacterium]
MIRPAILSVLHRACASVPLFILVPACTGDDASDTSTHGDGGSSDGGSSDGGSSDGGSSDGGSSDGGSSDGGSSDGGEALAIVGEWVDDFGGAHEITQTQWVQTFGADVFTYAIDSFDNTAHTLVAHSDDDDTWSRFDWTTLADELWYCQAAFGLDSAEAAAAATPADPADPANAGCGGFSWSRLTPQ